MLYTIGFLCSFMLANSICNNMQVRSIKIRCK
nr:MAG TPA: hypothetical protein [Caudoviricetes sp.]